MARRIGSLPSTLGGAVRAGFPMEMGGGFGQGEPLRRSVFMQASSVFAAVDTRFGPAYLAAGSSKGSSATIYLFLGPVW